MLPPPQPPADPYDVPVSPFKNKNKRSSSHDSPKETGAMTPSASRRDGTATPRRTPRSTPRRTLAKEFKDEVDSAKQEVESDLKKSEEAEEVNGQDEPAALAADEGVAQLEEPIAGPVLEIDTLKSHRVDKDAATVDFLVAWEGGEATWETEHALQTQAPTAVFEYWDKFGSREDATGLDIYHVFKILKRMSPSKGKEPKYLIQWVGYRRKESTWEPESKVKEMAPEALKAFEAKHGVATVAATSKKRPSGRGPGRPRKKVKQAANGTE
ncbi:Fc.00g073940.m01.CDS01 [Cosmosporella sp. VM-42]